MKRFPHPPAPFPSFALPALILTFALATALPVAAADGLYLHVHVEEDGGETVNLNLPLSTVESLLPMIPEDVARDGHVRLDEHDLDLTELRRAWQDLRSEPDFTLASIQQGDSNVHVAKEGEYLVARVLEGDGAAGARIHARIPARVVDALLSGDGDRLDLRAAIQALALEGEGELVTVEEDGSRVRVWVDGLAGPAR
jgi:hypothetical protein